MGQTDRRNALLQVDRLNVSYSVGTRSVTAVRDISLAVRAGEIVALLGESGSGKSSLARAIVGLSPKEATVSGDIRYGNHLISDFDTDYQEKLFGRLRGRIVASVFQDAAAALHPLMTVGKQMADVMTEHFPSLTNSEVRVKSRHILKLLHLPPEAKDAYPHELSGGQKQRAMLAIALAARPRLLVADEMTSALDQKTKNVLLDLVNGLALLERMGILYITHDPKEAETLCAGRVIVMYAGECMEAGSREHVLDGALHPYTKRLLDSDPAKAERQTVITAGERVTSPMEGACPYYSACPRRTSYCRMEKPFLQKVKEDHYVRCRYVPMEDD
jgi:oligopeptide/dipeptide ABC transporter ATP-binding protein